MAHSLIDRAFYEAILRFETSEEAQETYYRVMRTETGKRSASGRAETVRDQILRAYAMLFCDDLGAEPGHIATPDDVEATADRLHTGNMGFDPKHWYRMRHHFPVIDEDNYDRFAALVIADLKAGELHDAALNGRDMLLVGEADPLSMTAEQRRNQKVSTVTIGTEETL